MQAVSNYHISSRKLHWENQIIVKYALMTAFALTAYFRLNVLAGLMDT